MGKACVRALQKFNVVVVALRSTHIVFVCELVFIYLVNGKRIRWTLSVYIYKPKGRREIVRKERGGGFAAINARLMAMEMRELWKRAHGNSPLIFFWGRQYSVRQYSLVRKGEGRGGEGEANRECGVEIGRVLLSPKAGNFQFFFCVLCCYGQRVKKSGSKDHYPLRTLHLHYTRFLCRRNTFQYSIPVASRNTIEINTNIESNMKKKKHITCCLSALEGLLTPPPPPFIRLVHSKGDLNLENIYRHYPI